MEILSFVFALIALCFLIFFHELGHFLVARLCGVRVEIFSIGFGKRLIEKKYGNTIYAISLIPFGGYVKLKGYQPEEFSSSKKSDDKDSYLSKTPMQRILILFAGPFFNFILAFLLFFCVGLIGVQQYLPIIGGVQNGMPAQISGIKAGDKILYINGKKIKTWNELSDDIASNQEIVLQLERNYQGSKEILTKKIHPQISEAKNVFGESISRAYIGIYPSGEVAKFSYGFFDSLEFAYKKSIDSGYLILKSLKKLISGIIPLQEVGGAISIVDSMAKASQRDLSLFLLWIGLFSINLGILNLLPIPALDGGQILFNLYEWVTRKPLSKTIQTCLIMLGWGIILFLMLLGLHNDIVRLLNGSFR